MTLPPFEPIEHRFPEWHTARALTLSLLPERLRTVPNRRDPSVLGFDCAWAQRLVSLAPEEDVKRLIELLQTAIDVATATIPAGTFDQFQGYPVDRLLLNRIDDQLYRLDRMREAGGVPTVMQIVSHMIGIEPAPGCTHILLRVEQGVAL